MTSCREGRIAQPVGDGLYLIDTGYVRAGLAASHLLVDQGRAAFIDAGPGPAAPRLLSALDELGIAREQVEYCAPTPGVGDLVAFGAPFDALEFLLQFCIAGQQL